MHPVLQKETWHNRASGLLLHFCALGCLPDRGEPVAAVQGLNHFNSLVIREGISLFWWAVETKPLT